MQNTKSYPRILIFGEYIQARITELAAEIDQAYCSVTEPLLCIGVLNSSIFLTADLIRQLRTPLQVTFMKTVIERGESPGEVRIEMDTDIPVHDRDVLLIENVIETGCTMRSVMALLEFRGARSVRICALLDKVTARKFDIPIEFKGFEIKDVFVVGYGLDLDEYFRNLPYIGTFGQTS